MGGLWRNGRSENTGEIEKEILFVLGRTGGSGLSDARPVGLIKDAEMRRQLGNAGNDSPHEILFYFLFLFVHDNKKGGCETSREKRRIGVIVKRVI